MSFLSDSSDDDLGCTNCESLSPLQKEIFDLVDDWEIENNLIFGIKELEIELNDEKKLMYIIVDRYYRHYGTGNDTETVLRVWTPVNNEIKFVHLRDDWKDSTFDIGDYCFINGIWEVGDDPIGLYKKRNYVIIDSKLGNTFILQPHILITGTSISDAVNCERFCYISKFTPTDSSNLRLFTGNVIHHFIQTGVSGLSEGDMQSKFDNFLNKNIDMVYNANINPAEFKASMYQSLSEFGNLVEESHKKVGDSFRIDFNITEDYKAVNVLPLYTTLPRSNEEDIWCFDYGLKGKIDLTYDDDDGRIFPLEIKSGSSASGRPRLNHINQLETYILMLKSRYPGLSHESGVLFYKKDVASFLVRQTRRHVMNLILIRNSVAYTQSHYTVPDTTRGISYCMDTFCFNRRGFPDTPDKEYRVNFCSFLDIDGDQRMSDILNKYKPEFHKTIYDFYKENDIMLFNQYLLFDTNNLLVWIGNLSERLKNGRAFGPFILKSGNSSMDIILEISSDTRGSHSLEVGEYVVLTRSGLPPIIARGFVLSSSDTVIEIEKIEANFEGPLDDIYLDRWASQVNINSSRKNLLLFCASPELKRYRDLIIFGKEPSFRSLYNGPRLDNLSLNSDQQEVFKKSLLFDDYLLILGMAGTGKTTTALKIIEYYASNSLDVLVCALTHAAIDNICLKLSDLSVPYIRLGSATKVHERVVNNLDSKILSKMQSPAEVSGILRNTHVFCSTCYGLNRGLIASKRFDICIIDEATQLDIPAILQPISISKKFILIGDHYQLPPIVSNKTEKQTSLFRLLSQYSNNSMVYLRTQYRMNRGIMELANKAIYGGKMRCGNYETANRKLHLPKIGIIDGFHASVRNWILKAINPQVSTVFINTDPVPMYEQPFHQSKINIGEGYIISVLFFSLVLSGCLFDDIGIISPYRSQVGLVKSLIIEQQKHIVKTLGSDASDIALHEANADVCTVDKFQGSDKDTIILSLVKSNPKNYPGTHVSDWQRMNVAITRAKSKLIIIGSLATMKRSPFFESIINMLDNESIIDIPPSTNEGLAAPFRSFS